MKSGTRLEAAEDVAIFVEERPGSASTIAGNFFSFSTNDAYTTVIIGDEQFCASINLSHTTNRWVRSEMFIFSGNPLSPFSARISRLFLRSSRAKEQWFLWCAKDEDFSYVLEQPVTQEY